MTPELPICSQLLQQKKRNRNPTSMGSAYNMYNCIFGYIRYTLPQIDNSSGHFDNCIPGLEGISLYDCNGMTSETKCYKSFN